MKNKKIDNHNQLLNALSQSEYKKLEPNLTLVSFNHGQTVFEAGEEMEFAYFPQTVVFSLLSSSLITEVSLIGNEGMIGLPIILGNQLSAGRVTTQVEGTAFKIKNFLLLAAFQNEKKLQKILLAYGQAQLMQISQYSICNRHHTIAQRLARWLLSIQDRTDQKTIKLTHQTIANRLGCKRSGVTIAANTLQNAGIIQYHRGEIIINNREALEHQACECYRLIKNEYIKLSQFSLEKEE